MTVDSVRFQLAPQRGGGQGLPLSAQVGDTGGCGVGGGGGGGGGVTPPGGSEQCATMATVFTTPGQGSGRAFVLTSHARLPTHTLLANAAKPLSLHEEGAKVGHDPEGVPYSASGTPSITPFSHASEATIVPRALAHPQKGFVGGLAKVLFGKAAAAQAARRGRDFHRAPNIGAVLKRSYWARK
jgi:hypothetical protein